MKIAGLMLIALTHTLPAAAAPEESVKFVPSLKIYECPPNFQYRSDCKATDTPLETQKLVLNLEVLNKRMGQWNLNLSEPVNVAYYVIVVRGRSGKYYDYSVSTEAGLVDSPMPFSNGRVEFSENNAPRNFGVSSAAIEKDGKKYLVEIRISDFHGKSASGKK